MIPNDKVAVSEKKEPSAKQPTSSSRCATTDCPGKAGARAKLVGDIKQAEQSPQVRRRSKSQPDDESLVFQPRLTERYCFRFNGALS